MTSKTVVYVLMSFVNYSLVILGLVCGSITSPCFYAWPSMAITQIILTILNAFAGDSLKHHIILSIHLEIATIAAHFVYAVAYCMSLDYTGIDGETLLLTVIAVLIGQLFVAMISVVGIVAKNYYQKRKGTL